MTASVTLRGRTASPTVNTCGTRSQHVLFQLVLGTRTQAQHHGIESHLRGLTIHGQMHHLILDAE